MSTGSDLVHEGAGEQVRATIAVLTAGRSPALPEVLGGVRAHLQPDDQLVVFWSGLDECPAAFDTLDVINVRPLEFDHGGTRQLALDRCMGRFLVFLSDDASPADSEWLEQLLSVFADPEVGAVFGRQVPRGDSPLMDRVFREARYPAASSEIRLARRGRLSLIAPISNANAAYRVTALTAIGGFPRRCEFGEDRIVVRQLLLGGWKVQYAAGARALHTHYHTWWEVGGRGRAAAAGVDLRDWGADPIALARFAARSLGASWRASGLRGLLGMSAALLLRLAGALWGKLVASMGRRPAVGDDAKSVAR